MYKVAVMMSTYNGEKYVAEQIESILCQRDVEVELFIRDDGSSDATESILKEFAEKNANVHYDIKQNVGSAVSFMDLLYSVSSEYDFYAFADQDDVWLEDKLYNAVLMLKEADAFLYASNQECTDKEMNSIGLRYSDDDKIHLQPFEIMQRNMLAGCTMVLSREFFKLLKEDSRRPSYALLKLRMHDVWVAFIAALYGKLIYDKRSFIKYRLHENNVVGAKPKGAIFNFKMRMKKLFHKEQRNGRSRLAADAMACFPEAAKKFREVEDCGDGRSFKGKRKILKYSKAIRKISGENKVSFFFKVMFGLY